MIGDRWQAFVKWCRSEKGPGINDARQIDRKVLADYAAYLRDLVRRGDLAVSTAQNRLFSVNRTMAALRGDQCVKLPSPSKALSMQRSGVRQSVPQGQDPEQVKLIVGALCRDHQQRAAAIVLLARATGMRLREAILADLPRLSHCPLPHFPPPQTLTTCQRIDPGASRRARRLSSHLRVAA